MTLDEWVAQVCAELGIDAPDIDDVLDLARETAHRVARPAAPITALLVGLAAASTADLPAVMNRVRAILPAPAGDGPADPR